jgi:hypothetical protein
MPLKISANHRLCERSEAIQNWSIRHRHGLLHFVRKDNKKFLLEQKDDFVIREFVDTSIPYYAFANMTRCYSYPLAGNICIQEQRP